MKTLRRGSKAFFRDLYNDWRACTVLRVSGSGSPSNQIKVEIRADADYNMGFSKKGNILEIETTYVVPATAIEFGHFGSFIQSHYVCQETYPEKSIKKKSS